MHGSSHKTATRVDAVGHGSHVLGLELILLVLLILVRHLRGILDRGVSTRELFQSKGVSPRIPVVVRTILGLDLRH